MELSRRNVRGTAAVLVAAAALVVILVFIGEQLAAELVATVRSPADTSDRGGLEPVALLLGLGAFLSCQAHAVRGAGGFRLADAVTLLRSALLGLFTAVVVDLQVEAVLPTGSGLPWPLMVLAVMILVMDGLDGAVARAGAGGTDAGGRYDETTDAVMILVLSGAAALIVGWWAVVLGALRPLFALAQRVRPVWGAPLRPSRRRKVLGIVPSVLLLTALCPLPHPLAPLLTEDLEMMLRTGCVGVGLLMVGFSFVADVVDLERRAAAARS